MFGSPLDHSPRSSLFSTLFLALPFLGGCHVRPASLIPARTGPQVAPHSEDLRGKPESFVVLGDEGSFVWPVILQDLLDAHAGKASLYRVCNGSVAASGILPWTQGNAPAFRKLSEDYLSAGARLRDGAPAPRSALCFVSLAGIGDAHGPVKSENDMLGAEMGADALERLARELHETGVRRVVFATPFYVHDSGPELGLEHVAIERLLARGLDYVVAGPDLYRASRRYYPDAFQGDGAPNEFGLKLIAEEWYRWLAGPEAREDVVEALYARDYDVEALEASFERTHGLARP